MPKSFEFAPEKSRILKVTVSLPESEMDSLLGFVQQVSPDEGRKRNRQQPVNEVISKMLSHVIRTHKDFTSPQPRISAGRRSTEMELGVSPEQ